MKFHKELKEDRVQLIRISLEVPNDSIARRKEDYRSIFDISYFDGGKEKLV